MESKDDEEGLTEEEAIQAAILVQNMSNDIIRWLSDHLSKNFDSVTPILVAGALTYSLSVAIASTVEEVEGMSDADKDLFITSTMAMLADLIPIDRLAYRKMLEEEALGGIDDPDA